MTAPIFLAGNEVWKYLSPRIRAARRVHAAIAYLGKGATRWAPLRRGHVLVVDMSLKACKQGVTDPREIRKLIRRKVQVFSRANLHAKVVVADDVAIVGSANVSRNSATALEEAALVTANPSAVRATRHFVETLCTEPVRPRYLAKCIAAYRPPSFKAAAADTSPRKKTPASRTPLLWILGGLRYHDVPKAEEDKAEAAIRRARKMRHKREGTYVDQVHFPVRHPFMMRLHPGDWLITSIQSGRSAEIWPPRQLLSIEAYPRGRGKRRWTLQLEAPDAEQSLSLGEFRKRTARILPSSRSPNLRTRPIFDRAKAQLIHSLWTSTGRVSRG
jgi:hypothetical protein